MDESIINETDIYFVRDQTIWRLDYLFVEDTFVVMNIVFTILTNTKTVDHVLLNSFSILVKTWQLLKKEEEIKEWTLVTVSLQQCNCIGTTFMISFFFSEWLIIIIIMSLSTQFQCE